MAKKKKPAEQATPESAAASEHATEGSHKRTIIDLPGMVGDGVAKPEIPALDEAVLEYVKERDARLIHGVKEKELKAQILALMDGYKLGSYEVNDYVVVKKPKDATASIKVVSAADYTGDTNAENGED